MLLIYANSWLFPELLGNSQCRRSRRLGRYLSNLGKNDLAYSYTEAMETEKTLYGIYWECTHKHTQPRANWYMIENFVFIFWTSVLFICELREMGMSIFKDIRAGNLASLLAVSELHYLLEIHMQTLGRQKNESWVSRWQDYKEVG